MKTKTVNLKTESFDIYIGRQNRTYGLDSSIWQNPFRIDRDNTRADVIEQYKQWIITQPHLMKRLPELKGKRLGCWCAPKPCHGDILVSLLGDGPPEQLTLL